MRFQPLASVSHVASTTRDFAGRASLVLRRRKERIDVWGQPPVNAE